MKIKRVYNGIEYIIELTPDELEQAYREREHNYRTQDACHAIYEFAGYHPDEDEDDADNIEAQTRFMDKYGLSVCDLAEGAGEETAAIREDVIDKFNDIFDANCDENSLWYEAVRMTLEPYAANI